MEYTVEMASGGMMPSFMMIGSRIQMILRYLNSLRGCNVGTTDGRDL
jgi:hypothetical protein